VNEETLLATHPFLRGLDSEQRSKLLPCARLVRFPPGATILREDGPADTLYLLGAGHVVLEQHLPGRGNIQLESLVGGDILGLSWMLPRGRWSLDARAVEETLAVALDAACLHALMAEDPGLGLALATELLHHLYRRLERARLQRLDVYGAAEASSRS
jgi:CRP-like cAMP-binding protein